jgi:serine protease Do
MKLKIHLLFWMMLASAAGSWASPPAHGQLNPETKKLFEKLAPELDSSLKTKFEKAIADNQSTIDFTPDEFIRFRSHPANPFAGLDKIDPYAEPGSIRLEFKIPSIRDRETFLGERQHPGQLMAFQCLTAPAAGYTVQILADDQWVALGTVIFSSGLILTKASEVNHKSALVCRLSRRGETAEYPAKILRSDDRNDLAILRIEADDLTVAPLTDRAIVPGSIVVTPDHTGKPLVMGVISTVKRSLIGVNQAYMGVRPVNGAAGVELAQITPGGAAELAGLIQGDIVTHIGEVDIKTVTDVVNTVRLHRPGDKVRVRFRRGGVDQERELTLAGRNINGTRAAQYNAMNQFGAIPSLRRDDFPMVFQHDSPIVPEFCGGPLLDLDGNIVGINIARSGRVASYAIATAEIRAMVDHLVRENVAANQ